MNKSSLSSKITLKMSLFNLLARRKTDHPFMLAFPHFISKPTPISDKLDRDFGQDALCSGRTVMHLMYYLNEKGERVYTLKVSVVLLLHML